MTSRAVCTASEGRLKICAAFPGGNDPTPLMCFARAGAADFGGLVLGGGGGMQDMQEGSMDVGDGTSVGDGE